MNKKNNKGFTLVELLAVIIVLAIILVLAVPAVLSTMNNAKKKSFQMYSQKVLNAAQTVYEASRMMGEKNTDLKGKTDNSDSTLCINISKLGMENTGNYKGFVIITPGADSVASYTIYLTDGVDFMYPGTASANLDTLDTNLKKYLATGDGSWTNAKAEAAKYSECYTE